MATIKNIHDYSDIINLPYKKSKKYKHMSQKNRAAQFAPFAALTGHKQLIQETQRLTEDKKELDENKKSILNQKLLYFIETKEKIKITYFKKDQKKSGGDYLTTIQRIKKIDSIYQTITLQNGQIIKMEDIYEIEQQVIFVESLIYQRYNICKKEGVNMKDMNALNHKLQTMTRKELGAICKSHNCKINDDNLSIALHLMKNNPSSILIEEYQIIFLIELKKETSKEISDEFEDILKHDFIHEIELLH